MSVDIKTIINNIKSQWLECLEKSPEVFRYKLNIEHEKVLDGNFNFLVQLNKERSTKRRKAEKFHSIRPEFKSDEFNFTKIDAREILCEHKIDDLDVSFVINNSPLTNTHILVVPSLKACLPQVMTREGLELACKIMRAIDDRTARMGFNSPGALASVNHLHLHLLYVDRNLYVEDVPLIQVAENLHKVDYKKFPIHAFCVLLKNDIKNDALKLHKLIEICCDKNIPHNLLFTKRKTAEIGVFIFPHAKSNFGVDKVFSSHLNIAFCELGGFIPIGDEELYESITETYVLSRFNDEIGNVCDDIEDDFRKIFLET